MISEADWKLFLSETGSYVAAKKSGLPIKDGARLLRAIRLCIRIISHVYQTDRNNYNPDSHITYRGQVYRISIRSGDKYSFGVTAVVHLVESMVRDVHSEAPPFACYEIFYEIISWALESRMANLAYLRISSAAGALLDKASGVYSLRPKVISQIEARFRRRVSIALVAERHSVENFEDSIKTSWVQSIRRAADNYIHIRDYGSAVAVAIDAIDEILAENIEIKKTVGNAVVWTAAYYNSLLGVFPSAYVEERIIKCDVAITDDIRQILNPLSADFEVSSFEIALAKPVNVKDDGNKLTRICTVVSGKIIEGKSTLIDGTIVEARKISDPFDDPAFSSVHRLSIALGGLPLGIFSEAVFSDAEDVYSIVIDLAGIYLPDYHISKDGSIEKLDPDDGDIEDPYKNRIVSVIEEANMYSLSDDRPEISSYSVQLSDESADVLLFHFFRTLTSLNQFLSTRRRFVDRFNLLNLSPVQAKNGLDILESTKIDSPEALLKFTSEILKLTVVHDCENGELWKSFWDKESSIPIDESAIQIVIHSIIRPWFLVKGISLHREVRAGGGALDFLVSATVGGAAVSVAIELKRAHNPELDHGLQVQLPAYMADLRSSFGLFLVLWFRSEAYPQPGKFRTISEVSAHLDALATNYSISVEVVDCSQRTSPSKR